MSDKVTVKLKDGNCNHEPSFFQDTDKIHFVRNLDPNSDGDLSIEEGDIVIYTNLFQNRLTQKQKPIWHL